MGHWHCMAIEKLHDIHYAFHCAIIKLWNSKSASLSRKHLFQCRSADTFWVHCHYRIMSIDWCGIHTLCLPRYSFQYGHYIPVPVSRDQLLIEHIASRRNKTVITFGRPPWRCAVSLTVCFYGWYQTQYRWVNAGKTPVHNQWSYAFLALTHQCL